MATRLPTITRTPAGFTTRCSTCTWTARYRHRIDADLDARDHQATHSARTPEAVH